MKTNSDGQQVYRIIYISYQIIKQKRLRHITLEIQMLSWDRHQQVKGLDRLMVSKLSPS